VSPTPKQRCSGPPGNRVNFCRLERSARTANAARGGASRHSGPFAHHADRARKGQTATLRRTTKQQSLGYSERGASMRGTDGSANITRGEADLRDLLQDGRFCSTMHRMTPFKQATMVGSRVPTRLLLGFADALAVSKKSHNAMVGTSRAAVNRKMEADLPLCSAHSEYALGLARLIGHVLSHSSHSSHACIASSDCSVTWATLARTSLSHCPRTNWRRGTVTGRQQTRESHAARHRSRTWRVAAWRKLFSWQYHRHNGCLSAALRAARASIRSRVQTERQGFVHRMFRRRSGRPVGADRLLPDRLRSTASQRAMMVTHGVPARLLVRLADTLDYRSRVCGRDWADSSRGVGRR